MNRSANLTKISTAVPKHRYRQADLAKWMAERLAPGDATIERKLRILYQKTSIESRHSVLPDFSPECKNPQLFVSKQPQEPRIEKRMDVYQEAVFPLAKEALDGLLNSKSDYEEVTHLITVSCTGLSAPGLELQLKERLPFSEQVETHAVNFIGCYAFFPALKMAQAFCHQDPQAKVLILAVELCTLHFQNQDTEDHLLSNALFADGAAACLVEGSERLKQQPNAYLELQKTAQLHFPKGKNDMAWNLHASGFLMKLSAYVPELVDAGIQQLVNKLKQDNSDIFQIDQWAIHPGGRKILEVCAKELDLSREQLQPSYQVLKQYGNLSAPTILFVMQQFWSQAEKDKTLFACGFGPGLTLDGALFKWKSNA